jgi:integrase
MQHPGLELAQKARTKLQAKIMEEQRSGAVEAGAKTRMSDLLELIEQDYLRTGKKTLEDLLARWRLHLEDHFAGVYANELTIDYIHAYIACRVREGAAGGTINRELAVVARMMHLDERTTPARVRGTPHFEKVKESDPRTGFLEQHEYDKLRLHARDSWLRGLLSVYYTHGFRRAEMLNLRVRQVNLLDNTINLHAGATKNSREGWTHSRWPTFPRSTHPQHRRNEHQTRGFQKKNGSEAI